VFARQRKWSDAIAAFAEAGTQPGAKVAVFHNLAYALEQVPLRRGARSALDRPSAAAARAMRGANIPRRQSAGRRLKRRITALARARPLFGACPPTAAWYHYTSLPRHWAATSACGGYSPKALPRIRTALLLNNLAACSTQVSTSPRRRAAERGTRRTQGFRSAQELGDLHYRGAVTKRSSAISARRRQTPTRAGTPTKLGNIRLRRRERKRPFGAGSAPWSSIRTTRSCAPISNPSGRCCDAGHDAR
jgi:hypothetical protein